MTSVKVFTVLSTILLTCSPAFPQGKFRFCKKTNNAYTKSETFAFFPQQFRRKMDARIVVRLCDSTRPCLSNWDKIASDQPHLTFRFLTCRPDVLKCQLVLSISHSCVVSDPYQIWLQFVHTGVF